MNDASPTDTGVSPEIDFYLLDSPRDSDVLRLACRVVDKAYRSGLRVLLVARDADQAASLDDLLWTFSAGSFVPHGHAGEDAAEPVVITDAIPAAPDPFDAVVTLCPEPLTEAFHRVRILDIIGTGDREREEARRRFRHYRDRGCQPRTHRL